VRFQPKTSHILERAKDRAKVAVNQ